MSTIKGKTAREPVKAQLKQLGQKIRNDLASRGMTVDALALEIGVARSTLREIVAGRSNPRVLTLASIAQGLGYPSLKAFFADFAG